jgi:DNA-binding CsgD family transcriptional regulator
LLRALITVGGVTALVWANYELIDRTEGILWVAAGPTDTLWLMFMLPILQVSERNQTRITIATAFVSIVAMSLVTLHAIGLSAIPLALPFILQGLVARSLWIGFFSTLYHILGTSGYMAFSKAIVVARKNGPPYSETTAGMPDLPGALTREVEEKAKRLAWPHLNVFLIDEAGRGSDYIRCVAGSSSNGKNLAADNEFVHKRREGIIGHAMSLGPYLARDVRRNLPLEIYLPSKHFPDTLCEMAAPLHRRGVTVGVVDAQAPDEDFFQDDDLYVLEGIAARLSEILDQYDSLIAIKKRENMVSELSKATLETTNENDLFQRIADVLGDGFESEPVLFFPYDGAHDRFLPSYKTGQLISSERFFRDEPHKNGLRRRILRAGRDTFVHEDIHNIPDADRELFAPDPTGRSSFEIGEQLRSRVVIVVRRNEIVVGEVFLNFRRRRVFDSPFVQRLDQVRSTLALAMHRAIELYEAHHLEEQWDLTESADGTITITIRDIPIKISKREREVLTWASEGLENGEIAEKLVISKSTIRTHMSKIISKLEVKNRTEAGNKGRVLGILLDRVPPPPKRHS